MIDIYEKYDNFDLYYLKYYSMDQLEKEFKKYKNSVLFIFTADKINIKQEFTIQRFMFIVDDAQKIISWLNNKIISNKKI